MKWTIFIFLLALVGCKNNKLMLTGQEWQLKEITTNAEAFRMPSSVPTIQFTDSSAMFGFAGCNRFFGTYSVEKEKITINPGGMTMTACPDLESESYFIKALSQGKYYHVRDNELQITDSAKQTTLLFVPKEEMPLIGVADDAHGCNTAAGYTWSEVLQKCIRLFESGVRMNAVNEPDATSSVFLVFSTDSLKVEVFLPNTTSPQILDRRNLPDGHYAWNVEDDDTLNVRKVDGLWVIEKRMNVLYKEQPAE